MKNQIIVNGTGFAVKEFSNQRVVTVKEIANVHQVSMRNVQINYERNKKRFIEGVDYFALRGKKACNKLFVGSNITQINVFTETGYLMLTKSLTDDLSWKVQRELVNSYFKVQGCKSGEKLHNRVRGKREKISGDDSIPVLLVYPLLAEKYKKLLYYRMEKGLTQEETALVLKLSKTVVFRMEHSLKIAGLQIPKIKNNSNKYKLSILDSVQRMLELEA